MRACVTIFHFKGHSDDANKLCLWCRSSVVRPVTADRGSPPWSMCCVVNEPTDKAFKLCVCDRNMFFSLKKDSRTRGHEVKLVKDQCRLEIRKHSFSQRTIN